MARQWLQALGELAETNWRGTVEIEMRGRPGDVGIVLREGAEGDRSISKLLRQRTLAGQREFLGEPK